MEETSEEIQLKRSEEIQLKLLSRFAFSTCHDMSQMKEMCASNTHVHTDVLGRTTASAQGFWVLVLPLRSNGAQLLYERLRPARF